MRGRMNTVSTVVRSSHFPFFFFFNDPAPTEFYPLSLPAALPISPVSADVDPDPYCLDISAPERAITPRTRAIIPVHLAMRFTDMNALIALAGKHIARWTGIKIGRAHV